MYQEDTKKSEEMRAKLKADKPGEEVTQVDELAVVLVLDIDDTPSVFASTNGLAINDDIALRADDSERNNIL